MGLPPLKVLNDSETQSAIPVLKLKLPDFVKFTKNGAETKVDLMQSFDVGTALRSFNPVYWDKKDQYQNTSSLVTSVGTMNGNYAIITGANTGGGQTFLNANNMSLQQVGLSLANITGATGTFRFGVYATAAGVPTGVALGYTKPVDVSIVPTSALNPIIVPAYMDGNIDINNGVTYAIVVEDISLTNSLLLTIDGTATYANGTTVTQAGTWSTQANDANFLVRGVEISSTSDLIFEGDSWLAIPGLSYTRNRILAATHTLASPASVAYVIPNLDVGAAVDLTVNIATIDTLPAGSLVLARRIGDDLVVGANFLNPQERMYLYDHEVIKTPDVINNAPDDYKDGERNILWRPYSDKFTSLDPAIPTTGAGVDTTLFPVMIRTDAVNYNLRGENVYSIAAINATDYQGTGRSFDFSVEIADILKTQWVTFDLAGLSGGNVQQGDFTFYIYDIDNEQLIAPSITELPGLPNGADPNVLGSTRFVSSFQATDSLNYRFIIHVSTNDTTRNKAIYIDNIKIKPDAVVPGAIITDWESFTPTGNWSTNANWSGRKRRVGGDLEVEGVIEFTGDSDAANLEINIPDGLTMGDVGSVNVDAYTTIGIGTLLDAGKVAIPLFITRKDDTTLYVRYLNEEEETADNTRHSPVSGAVPVSVYVLNDSINFKFSVGIDGWSAGAMLSTTESLLMSARLHATLSADLNGVNATGTYLVPFDTANEDNLNGLNTSTGVYTIPKDGWYLISSQLRLSNYTISGDLTTITVRRNGTTVLQNQLPQTSTGTISWPNVNGHMRLSKGDTITTSIDTFGDTSITIVASDADTYFNITEIPDFSVFSIYSESEYLESASSTNSNWPVATAVWTDLTTLDIPPGEWDITGVVHVDPDGGAAPCRFNVGINTVAGNTSSGMVEAVNRNELTTATNFISGVTGVTVPNYRVVLTETTTFYLKGNLIGTPSLWDLNAYRLSARRIK